jgi:hypothetical protein
VIKAKKPINLSIMPLPETKHINIKERKTSSGSDIKNIKHIKIKISPHNMGTSKVIQHKKNISNFIILDKFFYSETFCYRNSNKILVILNLFFIRAKLLTFSTQFLEEFVRR